MAERPAPMTEQPGETRLADYRPPAFLIDSVDLIFDLGPDATNVRASLACRRNPAHGDAGAPLRLDGEDLTLNAVALDGEPLGPDSYRLTGSGLEIDAVPDDFVLDTEVTIAPARNTELSGLYVSGGDFFTQCEAEGFRRITFFADRPDVMARYTATIIADATRCPVLLSNGNPVDRGTLDGGRHWVKWADPHPKPSYLFALVAGDLAATTDEFVTRSGRRVSLGIYVRHGDEDRVGHAMDSLKRAMRWDEETFGLEYDLDIFNIAAVSDFNMGAMENKGLNIFNTALVLAKPETATDADYQRIDRVIAHEYFHNWTGDRVTCRDWFQLSLKEGLTVFRDQEYGADTTSAALSRIEDVCKLRASQFREDSGPLAHPVRPDRYRKIDNFYTPTVYEKGAEVVRMIRTIIGRDAFRRGIDAYIAKNDNSAATIEDFVAAMADASGVDFAQFMRWYDQAGTPEIRFEERYDAAAKRYELTLHQETRPTPGQESKAPFTIPVAMGLIGPNGGALATRLDGETEAQEGTRVLLLDAAEKTFVFEDVASRPVPSLFRGFSAPVKLRGRSRATLASLAAHDEDGFNRWDATQEYALDVMIEAIGAGEAGTAGTPGAEESAADRGLLAAMEAALGLAETDPALAAATLTLPPHEAIADRLDVVDPDAIHAVREALRAAIGRQFRDRFAALHRDLAEDGPFRLDQASIGRRALRNAALAYLMAADPDATVPVAAAQARDARTMTEVLAALALLADRPVPERDAALDAFHAKWRHDPLVIDKWFAIQARSTAPDALDRIEALARHPDFDLRNPNRFRALASVFGLGNPLRFHDKSGRGYAFLAALVLDADQVNRQIAARSVQAFADWRRYPPARQKKLRDALRGILAAPTLSDNTREMAERALGKD